METETVPQHEVLHFAATKPEHFRAAYVLSTIVLLLSAAVSLLGLVFPTVYRSEDWSNGTSLGNDFITLAVAVPLLATAMIYSARGSLRARLLWFGVLYYMIYNYAFYVFGIPVTKLYLPWIALVVLSAFAFITGMSHLNLEAIAPAFRPAKSTRFVAAFLLYVALMVSFMWISQWVRFLFTGHVLEVNGSQSAYQVIAAVDLSLLVPLQVIAAILLWRRRPLGYALSLVSLVQGALYTAVMATVCVFGWLLTPGSHLFSNWFINCVIGCTLCLLFLAVLLLNFNRSQMASR